MNEMSEFRPPSIVAPFCYCFRGKETKCGRKWGTASCQSAGGSGRTALGSDDEIRSIGPSHPADVASVHSSCVTDLESCSSRLPAIGPEWHSPVKKKLINWRKCQEVPEGAFPLTNVIFKRSAAFEQAPIRTHPHQDSCSSRRDRNRPRSMNQSDDTDDTPPDDSENYLMIRRQSEPDVHIPSEKTALRHRKAFDLGHTIRPMFVKSAKS